MAVLLLALPARAEPVVLRLASIAPEGTSWARELKAFGRDVESETRGQVRVKLYLGGIAGDESQVIERIRRGQLDGSAGSISCAKLAPSLRVLRVAGLFQRRDEAGNVLSHMYPILEPEFRKSGFASIAFAVFGGDIAFTRTPVHTLEELRKLRLWIWNLDDVWLKEMPRLGLKVVPLPVEDAGRAYEEGRIDGFLGLPTAALAYQWSTRARYFTDLRVGLLSACLVIANRAFDALPIDQQKIVRAAGVKLGARFDDINWSQEDLLLGGLFQRQGLQPVPASSALRADFFEAARAAREQLDDGVVPRALIERVNGWLADYRAEHR